MFEKRSLSYFIEFISTFCNTRLKNEMFYFKWLIFVQFPFLEGQILLKNNVQRNVEPFCIISIFTTRNFFKTQRSTKTWKQDVSRSVTKFRLIFIFTNAAFDLNCILKHNVSVGNKPFSKTKRCKLFLVRVATFPKT